MELKTLLTADYLDIVFDQRNKKYGGYELRRSYNQRLKKAVTIVLTVVAALLSFSFMTINRDQKIARLSPAKPYIFTDVLLPPPPVRPNIIPPPPSAPAHVNTKLFTANPKIEPDKNVTAEQVMPPATDMKNAQPGNNSILGDDANTAPSPGNDGNVTGTGVVQPVAHNADPFSYVQQMPQFPGDINSYLSSHLNYPGTAMENDLQGPVVVRFVVNEDGTVSNATIIRGIGGGCDEEALRMIKSMPKWTPGKQNGIAVKVFFSLSIRFELHN